MSESKIQQLDDRIKNVEKELDEIDNWIKTLEEKIKQDQIDLKQLKTRQQIKNSILRKLIIDKAKIASGFNSDNFEQ